MSCVMEIVCERTGNGTIREYSGRVTIYKWTSVLTLVGRHYHRRTRFFFNACFMPSDFTNP